MVSRLCVVCLVFVAFCCSTAVSQSYTWDDWTALDEYVQGDDGYFSWTELDAFEYTDVTVYIVNMTSQKWQDESFVDKSVWWHFMGIAVPNNLRHPSHGFLFIDGGSNHDDETPPPYDDVNNVAAAKVANETGACVAYIRQVPNQPIVFTNDPSQKSRSEDSIIAWTWRTYIDSAEPDPTVILRMPMTKSAKRGLDTLHEVAKAKAPETHIDKFTVAGASKRGWTTWSIACTDQRVVALVPMVFSLLNIEASVINHYQDMNGGYSFAFEPYWNENLTAEIYTPATQGVWDVEDMYRYRERLAGVYKVLMVSSGDEFFLLDDSNQWWNDMPEPKWLMMLPNAEHSMAPHYKQIYETTEAFWVSVMEDIPLPAVKWTMMETEMGGLIVLDTRPQPYNITAWVAVTLNNDTRKDYRLAALNDEGEVRIHPVLWTQELNVVDFGNGYEYGCAAPKVDGEWVGFFIQGTWEGPAPFYHRLVFTTQVNIVPYTWPRGPCLTNEECYGYLV